MKLNDICDHGHLADIYLDRYVNDGSPSGFTARHTTSQDTSPFSTTAWFHIFICTAPDEYVQTFGAINPSSDLPFSSTPNWVLVHPDMAQSAYFANHSLELSRCDSVKVSPTSSGRTVRLLDCEREDFVKLHYTGILGRITRELTYSKAISGPEVSKVISSEIDKGSLGKRFSILPETGARIIRIPDGSQSIDWGMVWRENKPYGNQLDSMPITIPAFSLFSRDRLAPHHKSILVQIIDSLAVDPIAFLFEQLIQPIVGSYFSLICKTGLQPEWNSQNLLISFNSDFSKSLIIARDLESVDKDISLMRELRLNHVFSSYPFKCIERGQYNYQIKHSFMFDFKLGECILEPLVSTICRYYGLKREPIVRRIHEEVRPWIERLPEDFFPKNSWFVFDNVLVDQKKPERPYIEIANPKFRPAH